MLQEYQNYLKNLRNNLIQCGVEYPVNEMSSYIDTLREASNLKQVLWFFSIMEVSASDCALQGYFIPLGATYKDKVRELAKEEFQEYLQEYSSISKGAVLSGNYSYIAKDIPSIPDDEELDLFEDEELETKDESYLEEMYAPPVVEEYHGTYLDDIEIPVFEEVHGVFLDEIDDSGEEFESHGIYLDEVSENFDDEYCDTPQNSVQYDIYEVHGVYIDDIESEFDEDDPDFNNSVVDDEYNEEWDEDDPDFNNSISDEDEYEDSYDDEFDEDDPDFNNSVADDDEYEDYEEQEWDEDDPDFNNSVSDEDEYEEELYEEEEFDEDDPDFNNSVADDDEYYEDYSEDEEWDDDDPDFANSVGDDLEDEFVEEHHTQSSVRTQVSKTIPPKKDMTDSITEGFNKLANMGIRAMRNRRK